MAGKQPVTDMDARYSNKDAVATEWAQARDQLAAAELYWISTVRPDGRPHVTPTLAVWLDDLLYFSTGPTERKARNLDDNPQVVITTGRDTLNEGLDLVVEGAAERVTDEAELLRVAAAYGAKYGSDWHFEVREGSFYGQGGAATAYQVAPVTAFGFRKGDYCQTRFRFES